MPPIAASASTRRNGGNAMPRARITNAMAMAANTKRTASRPYTSAPAA